MKTILKYFGIRKLVQDDKSPVYTFFAEASASVKARAYKKALRSASADQKKVIDAVAAMDV